jgi:hypothetical protein
MTKLLAMAVDARHPVTNHYSRIQKKVKASEKGTDMYNYVTSKRMNY